MDKLPSDRILFYISVCGVASSATDDDIYAAFPEAYINNIFPIEGSPGSFDLQFKDRKEIVKAIDCKDDLIKGEKFAIKFSELTRQEASARRPQQRQERQEHGAKTQVR